MKDNSPPRDSRESGNLDVKGYPYFSGFPLSQECFIGYNEGYESGRLLSSTGRIENVFTGGNSEGVSATCPKISS
jgi:hypothetical protein